MKPMVTRGEDHARTLLATRVANHEDPLRHVGAVILLESSSEGEDNQVPLPLGVYRISGFLQVPLRPMLPSCLSRSEASCRT